MKTLEQKRAEYSLQKVTSYLRTLKSTEQKQEFKSFVSGLPAMILQNGFGLTMVFLLSKKKEKEKTKHKEAFDQIKIWLTRESELTRTLFEKKQKGTPAHQLNEEEDREFLITINKMDQSEYRILQQETLALLEWIKRYAAAFVIKEESDESRAS